MSKKFNYSYSAPTENERKEIEFIRSQYEEKDKNTTKLERLRKLDNRVKILPQCFSITIGVIGLLIFGLGFTMVLEWDILIAGVIVSLVGCLPMSMAYLLHKRLTNKLKNKHKDEILELSKELLNQEQDKAM